jgi:hypothetical protein
MNATIATSRTRTSGRKAIAKRAATTYKRI